MHFEIQAPVLTSLCIVIASALYVALITTAAARRDSVAFPASLRCVSPWFVEKQRMLNFIAHSV